jgi:flagellar basal-body rod protein FlgG
MIERLGAGMQAQWLRQEVLANNLANVSTAGFKADDLAFEPNGPLSLPISPPGIPIPAPPSQPQGQLQWTDFSQGPVITTGRNLDVALSGPGFFVVDTPDGPRYTRAGSLSVGTDGTLLGPGGAPIQGERGSIQVHSADVSISETGEVRDGGRPVGTLRVVDFPRPYVLLKQGQGLFVPGRQDMEPAPARGFELASGAVEGSNVSSVRTMVGMIELHRLYEAYQRVIQAADETNRQAANDIGRV